MHNRPSPVADNALDPTEPDEKRARNYAQETKIDQPAQVGVRTDDGRHGHRFQSLQGFWPHIHALNRRACRITDSCSQHIHGRRVLRVRVLRIFRNIERVTQSDQHGVLRIGREENGGEVLIGHSRPVEGHMQRIAAADLLNGQPLDVAVVLIIDLTGSVRGQRGFVSEAGRPRGVGRDTAPIGYYGRLNPNHVGVVETELLADSYIAVNVFKRNFRWSAQRTGTGSQIKRGIQLVALVFVVRPQRERVAVLFRSDTVDQIQRLVFIVGVFLQDPGLDLRSAVGEGDAIKIVLNYGFCFRSPLFGSSRIKSLHRRLRHLGLIDGSSLRRYLNLALGLLCRSRSLGKILLEYRLEQHDDQKGQREDQEQATLHAWFLLRILEFCQIYFLNDCKARFRFEPVRWNLFA